MNADDSMVSPVSVVVLSSASFSGMVSSEGRQKIGNLGVECFTMNSPPSVSKLSWPRSAVVIVEVACEFEI